MFLYLSKYLFRSSFLGKNRQGLFLLAFVGIFLSAFALLVLQSTMGGLQNNLINRSKDVSGSLVISFQNESDESLPVLQEMVTNFLIDKEFPYSKEYEIELLMQYRGRLTPIIFHGIDRTTLPSFLKKEFALEQKDSSGQEFPQMILPRDLAYYIGGVEGMRVEVISPSHFDSFLGDVPRSLSVNVDKFITTGVPDVDVLHAWGNLHFIQNLIKKDLYNTIRIYGGTVNDNQEKEKFVLLKGELIKQLKASPYSTSIPSVLITTWEENNKNLVHALNLETTVMVFLFIAMTILVSICIVSGLMILLDKIKIDLASFWILGVSKQRLDKSFGLFLNVITIVVVLLGLGSAFLFLNLLDTHGTEIMPEIFVDRKIPIFITLKGIIVSFCVPYFISLVVYWYILKQFKQENSHLENIRTIG